MRLVTTVGVTACFFSLAVEFLWSHTTESMCVGYMSAQDSKAKVSRSRPEFSNTLEPHVG